MKKPTKLTQQIETTDIGEENKRQERADIKNIERVLGSVFTNARFYMSIIQAGSSFSIPLLELSEEEMEELKGPNWLNLRNIESDLGFNTYVHQGDFIGTIRGFTFGLEGKNKPPELTLYREPDLAYYTETNNPLIIKINRAIAKRWESAKARLEAEKPYLRALGKIYPTLRNIIAIKTGVTPAGAVESLGRLSLFLLLKGAEKGKLKRSDLENLANFLVPYVYLERERPDTMPYLGLEVEIPYSTPSQDPSLGYGGGNACEASFIQLIELAPVLAHFGIDFSYDNQGEVSLPPSRSASLQLALLEKIREWGFIPVDPTGESTPMFPLHVNIEAIGPSSVMKPWDEWLEDGPPPAGKKLVSFWTAGCICGLMYARPPRILSGEYYEPANFKEGDKQQTYRIEFRALDYNPNNSIETNLQMLESLRLIAIPITHALCENPIRRNEQLAKLYKQWMEKCTEIISQEIPEYKTLHLTPPKPHDYVKLATEILKKPQLMATLRELTQEYISATRQALGLEQNTGQEDDLFSIAP